MHENILLTNKLLNRYLKTTTTLHNMGVTFIKASACVKYQL